MRQTTIEKIRAVYKKGGKAEDCMNEVLGLVNCEDRANEMAEDTQELIFLAHVVLAYMDMSPAHPLFYTTRTDVKRSLSRLFDRKGKTDGREG